MSQHTERIRDRADQLVASSTLIQMSILLGTAIGICCGIAYLISH